MAAKTRTNPRSFDGKRGRKPPPRARSPQGIAAWNASTAVLISKANVPRVGKSAGDVGTIDVPVLLIEDNRMLRDGLTAMLSAQGLKVIATARSGSEVLRQVARLTPLLVLVNSARGDRDVQLVEAVKKLSPAVKVVVMHLLPVHEDVVALVRAGVSGFIMKDASVAEVIATIRSVADGASVLPPLMTETLFSYVANPAATRRKQGGKAAMRMTTQEREVTASMAEGLGNGEIAERLGIPAHTVRHHVHNILEKLALRSWLEVAASAHANRELTDHEVVSPALSLSD